MAYCRRERDYWRYFEIDPLIVWLALQRGYFQMLARHDPTPTVVVGDARMTLAREPDRISTCWSWRRFLPMPLPRIC